MGATAVVFGVMPDRLCTPGTICLTACFLHKLMMIFCWKHTYTRMTLWNGPTIKQNATIT